MSARGFRRSVALRQLGYRDYDEYLRSPEWAEVKRRYRASDLPQDCFCGETEGLHLHHLTYERVGREQLDDLTPLCPRCHSMVHVLERRGDIALDLKGLVSERRAKRYQRNTPAPGESWEEATADREVDRQRKSIERRIRAVVREAPAEVADRLLAGVTEIIDHAFEEVERHA